MVTDMSPLFNDIPGKDAASAVSRCLLLIVAMTLTSCGEGYDVNRLDEKAGKQMLAEEYMISASHPLAVEAGLEILRNGGNAVDAAVAVQMALTVVEPPESGIGGGGFMLYRDGVTGELTVYDGRETAPAAATDTRFMVGGRTLPLWAAVPTGLATGVPGIPAMLHRAHSDFGSLPWSELFEPAAALAESGVPMSGRLKRQIDNDPTLWIFRDTRRHFVRPRRADDPVLRNPELARTFRLIAAEGPEAFYSGPLTGPMIDAADARWPGRSDLTRRDFLDYQPVNRDAVCARYRNRTICGIPPPSSGGIALLQILGMLEHFPIDEMPPGDPGALHLIAEASRLAFADRARFIGDPAFVPVPVAGLIDSTYLAARAALIDPGHAMTSAAPGRPPGWHPQPDDAERNNPQIFHTAGKSPSEHGDDLKTTGTAHFSIADARGNMVSMTTSIEAPFGNRIMANGFLLNNQLTDFTFDPHRNGYYSPNAVAPGKRPRSSMAPVMVLDEDGDVLLLVGSRGGSRIIGYVLKTLIGVLDWGLPLQEAIALPNLLHRGNELEIEKGTEWAEYAELLSGMGHQVSVLPLESGVHGIERIPDEYRGGAANRVSGATDARDKRSPQGQTDHPAGRNTAALETGVDREPAQGVRYRWRGGADPRMEGVAKGD
ncbi:gamma-glutamyltransferase [Balneolales bacterium ANBcel1]|nr:gamma-glutamyltransferase [Balneolales bacterium ANBcel1]